ncbi:MAG: dTDP-glucose 4,6-dehydratase [Gaiellaceae bacterium]
MLVTGGCGFIGSHFVKRLVAAGDQVVVLDKLTYSGNLANLEGVEHEFVQGDIADPVAVRGAGEGCEAVVNFAAETHVDRSILEPGDFIRTDVIGTYVLLEWLRQSRTRFVQVSTDEVYGDILQGAVDEDAPLRPSSPYSASKAAADLQVLAYVRTYQVDASISRGANTYGSHQYPEKLIPLFITNALDAQALPLYGDGRQRRQWLHVDDHCSAVEFVLRDGVAGAIYNIGGEELENVEIVERIVNFTGADHGLVHHVDDRPGHDRRYCVDWSRIRGSGWEPKHDFETGLEETVSWYRENRSWWEPIKSGAYREYYARQYAERLGG